VHVQVLDRQERAAVGTGNALGGAGDDRIHATDWRDLRAQAVRELVEVARDDVEFAVLDFRGRVPGPNSSGRST
jgi:hypothetical protein